MKRFIEKLKTIVSILLTLVLLCVVIFATIAICRVHWAWIFLSIVGIVGVVALLLWIEGE